MADDAEEKLKMEFKRKSQKALTAIILSISTPVVPIVQSCTTPVEAWEALRGAFEKCTLAAKLHLRKKYFRMEMQEGGNAERHIREMKQITDRLAGMGSTSSEEPPNKRQVRCYSCNKHGHISRDCPRKHRVQGKCGCRY